MQLNQVTLPAANLAESIRFYRLLGLKQIVDSPAYARFECPGGSSFSLHQADEVATASLIYFECDDVDAEVDRLQAAGVGFISGPQDERWGWREARLTDPAGNRLCLYHAGSMRLNPPWRIDTKEQQHD